MKVFISWSGQVSHKIAVAFQEWLPFVIQSIVAYVSSEDIDKGARWATDIADELEDSSFGILCVTKENVGSEWLNFEAGALSKSIDKSRVCPFLFGIKRSEVQGPLLQFQSTIYEKEDVYKLIKSLNSSCQAGKIEEPRLKEAFDVWWPKLQDKLDNISTGKAQPRKGPVPIILTDSYLERILEEILEVSRTNQRLISSSEALKYSREVPDQAAEERLRKQMQSVTEEYRKEIAILQSLKSAGVTEIHRDRNSALEKSFASAIDAEMDEITIIGSSLKGLLQMNEEISEKLKYKVSCGLRVKCLLTHPAVADLRAGQEGRRFTEIGREIIESVLILKEWKIPPKDIGFYKGTPTCFAIKAGNKMLLNPYPYSNEAYNSPCFIVEKSTSRPSYIYDAFNQAHFSAWDSSFTEVFDDYDDMIDKLLQNLDDYANQVSKILSADR